MEPSFIPEANNGEDDANNIITFQKSREKLDENHIMVDILNPAVPYKNIDQTYITESSKCIENSEQNQQNKKSSPQQAETKKKIKIKKKKRKKKNKLVTETIENSDSKNIFNDDDLTFPSNYQNRNDVCPNTPNQAEVNENSNSRFIKDFDASNPNQIFSSLEIENNEKLKKEISANLRVQRIKEKRKLEEETRIQKLEEEEIKAKTRLSALQEQKWQKIVKNHEYYRAKSQKALMQRQILEEVKLKSAQSAMIKMETAEKRKMQILEEKQRIAMQKAADEWLKRHFAQQAILQMERRKQKQLKILAEKEKESTIRVQKMKSEKMKKEQTRRSVMKKFYASVPV